MSRYRGSNGNKTKYRGRSSSSSTWKPRPASRDESPKVDPATYDFKITTLNGTNWLDWIEDLEAELCIVGEWEFLLKPGNCPVSTTEADAWHGRQQRLKGWILKSIDRHVRRTAKSLLSDYATATEWLARLKSLYYDQSQLEVSIEYYRRLTNMRSNNYLDVGQYGEAMIKVFEELNKLGHSHDALYQIIAFMNGLDESWDIFRSGLRLRLAMMEGSKRHKRWPTIRQAVKQAQEDPWYRESPVY